MSALMLRADLIRLVVRTQRDFVEPGSNGAGRLFLLKVQFAAQMHSLTLGHIVLRHRPKAGQNRQRQIRIAHGRMRAREHQLPTVGHFRRGKLGLELLEIFQRLSILLCPVQCGSEQKVGVVKEVRLWDWCPEIFAGL